MKKSLLALALALSVMTGIVCFAVPASAARIAPYLSQYEEVSKPADSYRILMSHDSIEIWWGQDSIYGEWTPPTEYTPENRYSAGNGCGCWMDNDKKTALFRYGELTTATELVFADLFTAYGAGDYGYSKMQPSDWERFTLSGTTDGVNWFPIEYTVKYHLEVGRIWYGTHASSLEEPVDLWWHLVFDEAVEVTDIAFHTSNEASQDDASYELCFAMDKYHVYLLNGPYTSDETTEAPAPTEAPTTEAPATVPETDAATTTEVSDEATTEASTTAPAGEESNNTWIYIVVAAVVVIGAVVGVVIAKKRK